MHYDTMTNIKRRKKKKNNIIIFIITTKKKNKKKTKYIRIEIVCGSMASFDLMIYHLIHTITFAMHTIIIIVIMIGILILLNHISKWFMIHSCMTLM